jgi:hypothetical protein
MKKSRMATVAIGMAFAFPVATILDPKEAINNPHTHQEAPTAPMIDSLASIVGTSTATVRWGSANWLGWRELQGSRFRIVGL